MKFIIHRNFITMIFFQICGIFVSFCFLPHWSITEDVEINILEYIFDSKSNWDTLMPPKIKESNNESLVVNVSMFIRSIDKLDDRNMELKLQASLHMQWLDPRLNYEHTVYAEKLSGEYITLKDANKIWVPDIFICNEKQLSYDRMVVPNMHIRLYPNGTILFSKRIFTTLDCPMDLKNYPFDSQVCTIKLSSYAFTTKHISLRWKITEPVQISKNTHISYFELINFTIPMSSRIHFSSGDEHRVLSIDLLFSRIYSYYFNKFFLPVVIVVLISWIPLWLERVLYLRVYIAFSTVLFLGWYYMVQDNELLVSYTTALDTWNAANFIFVFMAALESIFISYMIKTNKNFIKRTHPDDSDEFKMLPFGPDKKRIYEVTDEKTELDAEILKIQTNFKICFVNVNKEVQILDAAAKLFFPSSYVLFLFFYWIMY